ncbi:MAG: aminodeoxychorismate synthase component I [Pirellulaceae bacterium]
MFRVISDLARLTHVHCQEIVLRETFLECAAKFASEPGTVILMSGGDQDCARYHILAARPWLTHRARHADNMLQSGTRRERIQADPLDITRSIIDSFRVDQIESGSPVRAGLFGYLGYDLKDRIEELPRTCVDDLHLPHLCLFAPSLILVHDRLAGTTRLHIPVLESGGPGSLERNLAYFHQVRERARPSALNKRSRSRPEMRSNLSRAAYLEAVSHIQQYIRAGDVYQVNMSQRFGTDFSGDGFELFSRLFSSNPAPFFAYVNAGDHEIISTSPERFLLQQGRYVETRPIKGTRPRGRTLAEDKALREELVSSVKDEAELSMIVDLLRNDLGKVCVPGTIRVAEHKKLEAYANVTHLVSRVVGRLGQGRDSVDLIKAAFPGGSITGCPKIRSMEIIDELEAGARHIYTGSIGYMSFHQTMDLSIAIRTATLVNSKLLFSVGGGVVHDSNPEAEYEETLHKGHSFFQVIEEQGGQTGQGRRIWHNGRLVPEDEARIPVRDLGFQYGYGLFETIRADQGCPCRLEKHLQRLRHGWETLTSIPFPELDWRVIVRSVLKANGLEMERSAIKIMLSRGSRDKPPYDRNIVITARAYTPPQSAALNQGVRLATYPSPRQIPLASHKTLNHLYYHLAGVWAREQNADQALILNPDHTVSETHAAGLLALNPNHVFVPESPHVLPSLMTESILSRLRSWGWRIGKGPLRLEALHMFEHLLVANSLLGAVSVIELDQQPVTPCHDLARTLTEDNGPDMNRAEKE